MRLGETVPLVICMWLEHRVKENRAWVAGARQRRHQGCSVLPWHKRDWRMHCLDPDWRFCGPQDFILRHGHNWTPQELPPGFRKGRLGRCGVNATRLALRCHDLTYVEGYALLLDPVGVEEQDPLGHSWLVDGQGRVIDPTWPEGAREYFGVPFRFTYLAEVCANGPRSTLIGRWQEEFPLLRRGTPVRVWKETRFRRPL